MKIALESSMLSISWKDCPRCGGEHSTSTYAQAFKKPIAGGYTHFVMCPDRQQPVLLRVLGEEES